MKKKLTFLAILMITLTQVFSQWQHSGGPEGTRVDHIEFAQGRLFANMNYYSDDNGDSWQEYTNRPGTKPITSFIEAGNRIMLTTNNTVYVSDDKGDSWSEKTSGLPADMQVPNVFTDGSTVYLVTYSGDLYKSTNNGDSWTSISDNLDKFKIEKMVFINGKLVAYTKNPFTADDAIHWSTDGETWNKSDFPDKSVTSLETDNSKIYAIAKNNGLYISSDDGSTFTRENTNITSGQIIENKGQLLYFSKDDGVNLLSKDGKTLTPKQNGIATNLLNGLVSGNNNLFLATYVGVYRSGNNADSWTLANKGLGYQAIQDMVNMGDTLFAGTYNSGVWRSYSYGLRWVPIGLTGKDIQSMVHANNAIYVVAAVNNTVENVYMSDDLGETWETVGTELPTTQFGSITSFKNNLIFKAFDKIYKLENFTGTWQEIKNTSGAIWANEEYLYVGGTVKQRTSDLSAWENLTGLDDAIGHFTKDNQYYYAGGITRGGSIKVMYRSSDGVAFSTYTTGLPNSDGQSLVTRNDTTYFAVTERRADAGSSLLFYDSIYVYQTHAGASGWIRFQETIPDVTVCTLFDTEESLLLASNVSAKGLYRYNFNPIPDVPDTVDQIEYPPVETALPSNISNTNEVKMYPNPVSNSLTIESIETIQSIRIYDLSGKIVKHSQVNGKGIVLDMSDLGEGMYLLQVQGQNGMQGMHKIIKQ